MEHKARQVKEFQVQITTITAQVIKSTSIAKFMRQVGRDAHASEEKPLTCHENTTRDNVLCHLSEKGVKLVHYDRGTVQVRGKLVRDVGNAASERLKRASARVWCASETQSMSCEKKTDARAAKNSVSDVDDEASATITIQMTHDSAQVIRNNSTC